MENYKTEYLAGIPYRQRLEMLQAHYLGAFKGLLRAERRRDGYSPRPGSEAARVRLEGRA